MNNIKHVFNRQIDVGEPKFYRAQHDRSDAGRFHIKNKQEWPVGPHHRINGIVAQKITGVVQDDLAFDGLDALKDTFGMPTNDIGA